MSSYPLLQQRPPDGHPLLQVLHLPLVLSVRVDLDLALVGVEQLQLLLQLHPQHLVLRFLGLIQSQLRGRKTKEHNEFGTIAWDLNFFFSVEGVEEENLRKFEKVARGICTRQFKSDLSNLTQVWSWSVSGYIQWDIVTWKINVKFKQEKNIIEKQKILTYSDVGDQTWPDQK